MFLSRLKILYKLPLFICALILVSTSVIGFFIINEASKEIINTSKDTLLALTDAKASKLNLFFSSIQQDLSILSRYDLLKINEAPPKFLSNILENKNYTNILFFDKAGNLTYAAFREPQSTINAIQKLWIEAEWLQSLNDVSRNSQTFFDFKLHSSNNNVSNAFFAQPVFDENGYLLGAVALQISNISIDSIMQNSAGLGHAGESYIAGEDYLKRSNSRFAQESSLLTPQTTKISIRKAVNGETGVHIAKNYRKKTVLSAYAPFHFMGQKWTIITEREIAEITAPIDKIKFYFIILASILITFIPCISIYISRMISNPIHNIANFIKKQIVEDNYTVEMPEIDRHDEIGDVARAIQSFKEKILEKEQLKKEKNFQIEQKIQNKKKIIRDLEEKIQCDFNGFIIDISTMFDQIKDTASFIRVHAEHLVKLSLSASQVIEKSSSNISSITIIADELTTSVSEIISQISKSSHISSDIVNKTHKTSNDIEVLISDVRQIDQISRNVADALEQQAQSALEIEKSIQQESKHLLGITHDIADIVKFSQEANKSSKTLLSSAQDLSKKFDLFNNSKNLFLKNIQSE